MIQNSEVGTAGLNAVKRQILLCTIVTISFDSMVVNVIIATVHLLVNQKKHGAWSWGGKHPFDSDHAECW